MIAIGCDHAGYELKKVLIEALSEQGFEFKDMGCNGERCDYPVIAEAVCGEITSGRCDKGILICGTGIGMSIASNKIKGIRSALCSDCFSTKYTRLHNDSNVMCLGGKVKFACVDGPEFDGHLIDFDQAMRRQAMYKTEEGRKI